MDLRVEKTLQAIKQAYYVIKRGKTIGQIRVTEICEKAMINKSTFYKYYLDVYDLADKMETEIVRDLMATCKNADKLFSDTEAFVSEMTMLIVSNLDRLKVIFDDRADVEIRKFEEYLMRLYLAKSHAAKRDEMIIRFCIGGAAHILMNERLTPENVYAAKSMFVEIVEKLHAGA